MAWIRRRSTGALELVPVTTADTMLHLMVEQGATLEDVLHALGMTTAAAAAKRRAEESAKLPPGADQMRELARIARRESDARYEALSYLIEDMQRKLRTAAADREFVKATTKLQLMRAGVEKEEATQGAKA